MHLDNGAHYGFSDLQWSVPQIGAVAPERRVGLIGTITPRDALKAQRDYVGAISWHWNRRSSPRIRRSRRPARRR